VDDPEIVNYEYIHDVVDRFAKDVIERRISFHGITDNKAKANMIELYADMGFKIRDYFNGNIKGQERADLEKDVFDNLVTLNSANLIIEKELKQSVIEEKIEKLEDQIESSNKLMINLLKLLQEVSKKLDKI